VARQAPEEFDRLLQLTPYSQAEHREAVAICRNPDGHTPLQKAWAYYVNINCSFSHNLGAGWGTGVTSNQSARWNTRRQRIPECLARLQETHIGCEDALAFIARWDSPQTLHYLDPPYPGTDLGHYDGYTLEDWAALCDLLDSIEGSYVLSNYPQEVQPASAQQRIEIATTCSGSSQGKAGKGRDKSRSATVAEMGDRARTEVLWICDRSSNIRNDLGQALARRQQLDIFTDLASAI